MSVSHQIWRTILWDCGLSSWHRTRSLTSSTVSSSSSSSSSTNFIATQVLKQNFRAAVCHVLHYSCNVNAAVADSLHCRMICGTVSSSVHAWMPPATAATWSPAAAHSKSLPRRQGRRDRRWSCATTVEHAATVTMQTADAYKTRCRRPAVAHCRDNVVLCRSYNGKLERRDGSWSALERAASGAHEEEETRAHSSLPSTRDGRQNLWRTLVGSVALQANQPVSSSHSPVASAPVMQPTTGGLV